MYIHNSLLIRLLKILRQSTTGFVFLRAHQATAECAAPGRLMFQPLRYSRYRDTLSIGNVYNSGSKRTLSIRNALLIRLLKIRRQPTISFALLGAHRVGAVLEFTATLYSTETDRNRSWAVDEFSATL
ncbi:hypothetical protein T265_08237 [Opisthorchis viverrini]|uniref:Uncharacterized protein n=1 Tax=Opisthorchis viverrini TaxID=6198 RepID=A0A074ZEA8_OPIVI|nr:hypothetical protein T265_08237 [Opisthorchis viverrini]KER23992.1 hypothetical protein T265_08237 [Opisthorchis viverrini]